MVEQKKPKRMFRTGALVYAYTDYIVLVLSVFIYLVIASKMFLHCTGNHSDSYVTKERPARNFAVYKRPIGAIRYTLTAGLRNFKRNIFSRVRKDFGKEFTYCHSVFRY